MKNPGMSLAFALVALLAPLLVGSVSGNYGMRVLDFALLYVMLALGLNIVVGFAGLLDLGYIAFYAVGAYTAALLRSPHLSDNFTWIAAMAPDGLQVPFWIVVVIAMTLSALFGILLGAPTLRLRGDYLAIVTLGFGEIIRIFLNNMNRPLNVTNGPSGISAIEPVTIAGFDFSRTHSVFGLEITPLYAHYYLFLFCAAAVVLVCARLQHSRIGRAWAAIREDEIAAKAMGVNTRNMKLLAFSMGASFGGLSGVMFASFQGFVSPESFTFWESIVILACVVLGGIGHIPGVILGALLLAIFPEVLRVTMGPLQDAIFGHQVVETEIVRQLIYGLAMVLIMLFRSEGLWPASRRESASGVKIGGLPSAQRSA